MEPYILYATLPPGPPPPSWDLDYEADGLPEAAVPPMSGYYSENMTAAASGGLLHLDVPPLPDFAEADAVYNWSLPAFTTLEFEVSWPTLTAPSPSHQHIYAHIYTSAGAGLDFACVREAAYERGWSERNYIYNNIDFYWEGPLIQTYAIKLVQNPGPGQYDIFLNGEQVGAAVAAAMDLLGFSVMLYGPGDTHVTLDYLRAKITT